MRTLFDGVVRTTCSILFLQEVGSDPDVCEDDPARDWEVNGLVSYAHEGGLALAIGRDDGLVHVRVELHATVPPLDLRWEEVAEASLTFRRTDLELVGHGEAVPVVIPTPAAYRFRFSASLMDEGRAMERSFALVVGPDDYLLQLWAAPPGRDVTIKETSRAARGEHDLVRRLFPPPARSVREFPRPRVVPGDDRPAPDEAG